MSRRLSLTLAATKGKVHDFAATIAGKLVLSGDASQARSYSTGELPDAAVEVRVLTTGVVGAQYTITVVFADRTDGFAWRYTLSAPVQTVAFHV